MTRRYFARPACAPRTQGYWQGRAAGRCGKGHELNFAHFAQEHQGTESCERFQQ